MWHFKIDSYWFIFVLIRLNSCIKRNPWCTRSLKEQLNLKSRAARAKRSKEQMGPHAMWNKHIETLLMSTLFLKELPRYVWQKRILHCLSKKIYLLFWNIFRKHLIHMEEIKPSALFSFDNFCRFFLTFFYSWLPIVFLLKSLTIFQYERRNKSHANKSPPALWNQWRVTSHPSNSTFHN